jgi:hypothetical protein
VQSSNIIPGFVANCTSPLKSEVFANGALPRAFVTEGRVKAGKDSQEISRTSNDQLFIGSSHVVLTASVRIRALKNVLFSCTRSALPVTRVSTWRLLVRYQKARREVKHATGEEREEKRHL